MTDSIALPLSPDNAFVADDHLFIHSLDPRSSAVFALDRWPPQPAHLPDEQILGAVRFDEHRWVTSSLVFGAKVHPTPEPTVTHTSQGATVTTFEIFHEPRATTRGLFMHQGSFGQRLGALPTESSYALTRVGHRVMVSGSRTGSPAYFDGEGLTPIAGLPEGPEPRPVGAGIRLGDGTVILFFAGDAYEIGEDGAVGTRWALGAEPAQYEVPTLLRWGEDGFYYLSGSGLHRVRRGQPPAPVLEQLEDITSIQMGPGGSLLLGRRGRGKGRSVQLASLGFPDTAEHIPIRRKDLALDPSTQVAGQAYSAAGEHIVFVVKTYSGPIKKWGPDPETAGHLVLLPVEPLLDRRRFRVGLAAGTKADPLAQLKVLLKKTGTEAEVRALAREANDPAIYDYLLDDTVTETATVWVRKRLTGDDGQPKVEGGMREAVEIVAGKRLGAKKGQLLIRSQLARELIADAPPESQRASALKTSIESLVVRGIHKIRFKEVEQRSIDCASLTGFPHLARVYFEQLVYRDGLVNTDALRGIATLTEIHVGGEHVASVDEIPR